MNYAQRTRRDSKGRDYYQDRKKGMIPEEDPSIDDIIEERMTDKEAFQET